MSATLPSYETLDALQDDLAELQRLGVDAEYAAKQLHHIPEAMVVDRGAVIVEACRGKRVLNLGCGGSGVLHQAISEVAKEVYCVDCEPAPESHPHHQRVDLDEYLAVKAMWLPPVEVIVAGEILEHLTNFGQLLRHLRQCGCPIVVSVPNAMSTAAAGWVERGYENVHWQHTCWFSYHTLQVLMERCGYQILNVGWYNGAPGTAEGLVCIAEPKGV